LYSSIFLIYFNYLVNLFLLTLQHLYEFVQETFLTIGRLKHPVKTNETLNPQKFGNVLDRYVMHNIYYKLFQQNDIIIYYN